MWEKVIHTGAGDGWRAADLIDAPVIVTSDDRSESEGNPFSPGTA